jgi:hypothetical protein
MHESIRRSYELLDQLDDDEHNQRGAFAPRNPDVTSAAEQYARRAHELRPAAAPPKAPANTKRGFAFDRVEI